MATVRARVLIGWFERQNAIDFLLSRCVFDPPIDAAQAEAIWRPYRDAAEALPVRVAALSPRLGLTIQELGHQKRFMAFLNSRGKHRIGGAIKLDLQQLGVHQLVVVTEQADKYRAKLTTDLDWRLEFLPVTVKNSGFKAVVTQINQDTNADIDVPHAEFSLQPDPTGSVFSVAEHLRHVTVAEDGKRTYLMAGYHRSFAKILSAPAATVPSAVVALASNTVVFTPNQPLASAGLTTGGVAAAGLWTGGDRCPLLSDFFTPGLFMDINLRKKRYQLQVRSTWVEIDAP
jgi:hypothetical protein